MKLAKDSLTFYEYYARKGRWFCQSATPDSTVGYVDRTLRFALRQPDTPRRNGLLAYTYNCQGINYHNFHRKADEVVSLYQSAYAYSMRSDVQHQAPSICANLGDAYLFKNQLPQAASWYRRALFLVDSLQLPKEENVSLYVGLATIYLKLNDFDASLQCYQQTEDHLPQMSLAMQAYYLNNYGNYYYYKKDYAQSLRKFLQLKQLLEKHKKGDCFDMYLCKLNMADVYLNLDSIAQSEKYLAESEPFMVANHDREAVYYCNTIHIGQEVKKGDMAAVTRILNSERQQFGEDLSNLVAFNLRQIRNQYLQRYYLAKGDYRMAFENLRRDMQKNDSLEHNRINMRASEIMDRFTQDTLKLHHDLVLEHKTAQLNQTRFIALAVVLLILLLCMFFVIKSMRSGKRLEESRHRVLQLKLEGARNRISPHFVFNVLNNKILHAGTAEADELMGLARLIRSNLDLSCQSKVSLAAEIGFVKQYLAVETPLMGDDFDFSLQIDPEVDVENTYIPSMFVQILVENALVHGLRGWEGRKTEFQCRIVQLRSPADGTAMPCLSRLWSHFGSIGKICRSGSPASCAKAAALSALFTLMHRPAEICAAFSLPWREASHFTGAKPENQEICKRSRHRHTYKPAAPHRGGDKIPRKQNTVENPQPFDLHRDDKPQKHNRIRKCQCVGKENGHIDVIGAEISRDRRKICRRTLSGQRNACRPCQDIRHRHNHKRADDRNPDSEPDVDIIRIRSPDPFQ